MKPNTQRTLVALVTRLGVYLLTSKHLHYDSLTYRIVDLSIILIKHSVSFIGKFRFVIPSLSDNHWLLVLLFDLLLLHRLTVIVESFANHNST